jgi:hypothetical protein
MRTAFVDAHRKLGAWGLVAVATAIALAVIGGLEHGRFDVDSVSATVVFVLAVLVAGYLVFLALATGRLEADRDQWHRDYDVVNGWGEGDEVDSRASRR